MKAEPPVLSNAYMVQLRIKQLWLAELLGEAMQWVIPPQIYKCITSAESLVKALSFKGMPVEGGLGMACNDVGQNQCSLPTLLGVGRARLARLIESAGIGI